MKNSEIKHNFLIRYKCYLQDILRYKNVMVSESDLRTVARELLDETLSNLRAFVVFADVYFDIKLPPAHRLNMWGCEY